MMWPLQTMHDVMDDGEHQTRALAGLPGCKKRREYACLQSLRNPGARVSKRETTYWPLIGVSHERQVQTGYFLRCSEIRMLP